MESIAPLFQMRDLATIVLQRVLDAEVVVAEDGVRHEMVGAARDRMLVQAHLSEDFPAHRPAISGMPVKIVAASIEQAGLAVHHCRK